MTSVTISKQKFLKKVKLHSYAGEWVAFVDEKITAHNKDLKDLMKEIDAKGLRKKASVLLVPRKDEGPYILYEERILLFRERRSIFSTCRS